MTARQLVIATLKDLTRECLREQVRLKMVLRHKGIIEMKERDLRRRIKMLKMKVDRELVTHKGLLGVGVALEDSDGEEWKQTA